jgi:hypothetical protein
MNEIFGAFCLATITTVNSDGTVDLKITTVPRYDDTMNKDYLSYPSIPTLSKVFVIKPVNIFLEVSAGDLCIYFMSKHPILETLLNLQTDANNFSNGFCMPIAKFSDLGYNTSEKTYIKGNTVIGNVTNATKLAKAPATNANFGIIKSKINAIITNLGIVDDVPLLVDFTSVATTETEGS